MKRNQLSIRPTRQVLRRTRNLPLLVSISARAATRLLTSQTFLDQTVLLQLLQLPWPCRL